MGRRSDLDTVTFYATIGLLAGFALPLLVALTPVVLTYRSPATIRCVSAAGLLVQMVWSVADARRIRPPVEQSAGRDVTTVPSSCSVWRHARHRTLKSATARLMDSLFISPLVLPALAPGLALMFFSLMGWTVRSTLVLGIRSFPSPMSSARRSRRSSSSIRRCSRARPVLVRAAGTRFAASPRTDPPGILAGAFIFMSSFDNIPVSLFLRGADTELLPIRMWQDLDNRLDVTTAAVSGVWIAFTVALMVVMERSANLSRRLR
jgi:putative spermidine/putrescine transport system permease protein